ncbi:hypothetical protein PSU4_04470 [Pseudonocardia sulfidoxydans NBRC 16205]|uniref:Adenosine deaminase domain-containing protein n=1 Tax=Pseudonocardia sulfidoxydans NBRC 16205 TaxID=1223511 RepID=A0A511DAU1_9PSEU|nr:hypothetical protein [Pseudonocardia sulfidoxydans]GEL21493.1 hypothetical protein PSU4_04470 [Pseudonocardia sulfidoxydans NBRC 16205]
MSAGVAEALPKAELHVHLDDYPVRALHEAGVVTSVNSDDPPCFGGYVADNHAALGLSTAPPAASARNSFTASFTPAEQVAAGIAAVDAAQRKIADAP